VTKGRRTYGVSPNASMLSLGSEEQQTSTDLILVCGYIMYAHTCLKLSSIEMYECSCQFSLLIQLQNQGEVAVLYAVLPKSRDLQKTLKKQLGVKASRKAQKVQTYQVSDF
jgi:hypothetical protein